MHVKPINHKCMYQTNANHMVMMIIYIQKNAVDVRIKYQALQALVMIFNIQGV